MSPELIAILAVGVASMALNLTIARMLLGEMRHMEQWLDARMDRLEDRMDRVENRMDRLEDKIDRLDDRVDEQGKEIARIGGLLDGLREAIYGRATSV